MTYKTYYKIAKSIPDNPEIGTTTGVKAILDYEKLHPHNISQETAIMLEQFYRVTRTKIGGEAKAIVVPKGSAECVNVVDKVLLEYCRLEKDFEGSIDLESTEEGFRSITGEPEMSMVAEDILYEKE